MVTKVEAVRGSAKLRSGGKRITAPVDIPSDLLADIAETVVDSTKLLAEMVTKNPDSKADLLPILEQLVQLSVRMIQIRHNDSSGHPPRGPVDSAAGKADDGGMEARISSLEKDMAAVKTDVAVIRSNYATKTDIASLESTILKWFIGTAVTLVGLAFAAAKLIN